MNIYDFIELLFVIGVLVLIAYVVVFAYKIVRAAKRWWILQRRGTAWLKLK